MGLIHRLYHGETTFPLIRERKKFYAVSLILVVVALGSMLFRGFNLGVEFKGGATFQFPVASNVDIKAARSFVEGLGIKDPIVQTLRDTGGSTQLKIETPPVSVDKQASIENALASQFKVDANKIATETVGPEWGSQVTKKALEGLVVFLIAVVIYISIRFEPKMAASAIIALIHDLILAAGVYSVLGFVVTPSTVIALLTVLGYSLYDTIVVFDKVEENTRGLEKQGNLTYAEAAELAVNQTFMRSINTSLIALLPVSGLLFVGALLLGAGTLKDLALALFVGLASGAYSSLFLATPLLADFKEREPRFVALSNRVHDRRASGKTSGPVRLSQRSGHAAGAAAVSPAGAVAVADAPDAPVAAKPAAKRPAQKKKGNRPSSHKNKKRR